MIRKVQLLLIPVVFCGLVSTASARREIIDPEEANADPDFGVQGEYTGGGTMPDGSESKAGAQVIAEGKGNFRVVVYQGGLPGAGWTRGEKRFSLSGKREGDLTTLSGKDTGGTISGGVMKITDAAGKEKIKLTRTQRKSPTLGQKPPSGAVVLFDGKSAENFQRGRLTKYNTLLAGTDSKGKFNSYSLHLEFCLSWMPNARGQGRSNSGVYAHDCYEIQVLDSFGLEGRHNECGGIYKLRQPDVNMCLPPLSWQTYDIDFTAPKYSGGKKVANARMTVRHNGVMIHDDFELPRNNPGRQGEGPGPRPLHLQGHGCRVQYRNIWLVEKK